MREILTFFNFSGLKHVTNGRKMSKTPKYSLIHVNKSKSDLHLRSSCFIAILKDPTQSEYVGKFSGQSDDTSPFYRTRKVDDGFYVVWNYVPSLGKWCRLTHKFVQNVHKRVLYKMSSRGALGCYRGKSEFRSQTLSILQKACTESVLKFN